MREIKFRGWHTVQKKMFSAEEMAADQLTLLPTGSFINVSGASTRLSEIYPSDLFIPLQFTGLHDRNGKEVYEGDIVRAESLERVHGCIEWDGHGFWIIEPSKTRTMPFSENMEIIGNLYENPELLKS